MFVQAPLTSTTRHSLMIALLVVAIVTLAGCASGKHADKHEFPLVTTVGANPASDVTWFLLREPVSRNPFGALSNLARFGTSSVLVRIPGKPLLNLRLPLTWITSTSRAGWALGQGMTRDFNVITFTISAPESNRAFTTPLVTAGEYPNLTKAIWNESGKSIAIPLNDMLYVLDSIGRFDTLRPPFPLGKMSFLSWSGSEYWLLDSTGGESHIFHWRPLTGQLDSFPAMNTIAVLHDLRDRTLITLFDNLICTVSESTRSNDPEERFPIWWQEYDPNAYLMAFSPDGEHAVLREKGRNGPAYFVQRNVAGRRLLPELPLGFVFFSPDGNWIIGKSWGNPDDSSDTSEAVFGLDLRQASLEWEEVWHEWKHEKSGWHSVSLYPSRSDLFLTDGLGGLFLWEPKQRKFREVEKISQFAP